MTAQSPALTQAALVAAAGRKAQKVQRKLHEAEAEMHTANKILVKVVPTHDRQGIEAAVEQNVAAEGKVRDAVEELEVVKELLADAETPSGSEKQPGLKGQSGQGAKSVIPHLPRRAGPAS
jgi:hypothetical protein